jgi:hypothetical protein
MVEDSEHGCERPIKTKEVEDLPIEHSCIAQNGQPGNDNHMPGYD